ncbi:MAG: WD40 repeat domain-containing protein, partial [Candidatus Hodarchaeota archaeon]
PICLLEKYTLNTRLVAISPNGLYIISGFREKSIKLWNFEKIEEEKQKIFEGHEAAVELIAISPDGKYIISSSRDGIINIWEFKSKNIIYKLDDYSKSLIISPDGKYFIRGNDDIFKIREFMTGKLVRTLKIEDHMNKFTISPDEKYIIYTDYHDIKVLEIESEKLIRTFKGHKDSVYSVKVSLDSKYIFSGSEDKTVKVWEFDTGKLIHTLYHDDQIRTMDVHPEGKYIVTGDMGRKVYVWEFETGELVHQLEGHGGWLLSVAFSPDGKYFISGSHYQIIEIWEFMTGRLVCTLEMHKDAVNVVIFTPDGKYILSGSDDKTLRIWNFEEILKADEEEKRKIAEIENLYIEGTKLFKKGEDLANNKEFYEATFNMTEAIEKYKQGIKFAENYGLIELEKKLKNVYSNTNKEISRISRMSKITTSQKLPVEPKKMEEPKVNVYRGGEIQGGKYIFKIKVQNNTKFNITDLIFQVISFPEDSTKLVGESSRKISKLSGKGLVSPSFEFLPTRDCITGTIHSTVTYIDHLNQPHTITTEPFTISIICGLLRPKQIKIDEFYKIIEELLDFEKTGEEITIPYNSKLIFNKLKILLPEQNFWMVTKPKEQIVG